MPRGPLILIVILLLVLGGVVLLSRSVDEQPVQTIETDVARSDAAN